MTSDHRAWTPAQGATITLHEADGFVTEAAQEMDLVVRLLDTHPELRVIERGTSRIAGEGNHFEWVDWEREREPARIKSLRGRLKAIAEEIQRYTIMEGAQ